MSVSIESFPGGGGVVLAVALCAGAALLAGQEIASREIANLNWLERCRETLLAVVQREEIKPPRIPVRRCADHVMIPGQLGAAARDLCHMFGNPDANAAEREIVLEAYEKKRAAQDKARKAIAATAGTQCGCAEATFKTKYAIQLGAYTATARFVTLPPIENMQHYLEIALGTPQCQALAEG